jgi:hypothetical protein
MKKYRIELCTYEYSKNYVDNLDMITLFESNNLKEIEKHLTLLSKTMLIDRKKTSIVYDNDFEKTRIANLIEIHKVRDFDSYDYDLLDDFIILNKMEEQL